MSLNKDNMLNLGSIVKIRGTIPPVMIIGYTALNENLLFDYVGCLYPFGVVDSEHHLFFNNSDIKKVIDNGFSNGKEIEFKENRLKALDKIENIEELRKAQNVLDDVKKKYPEMISVKILLPVGSIVKIKNDDNKYMIISNLMENVKDGKTVGYDYMAYIYPFGFVNMKSNYFFYDEDITDVYYIGYNCNEETRIKILTQYRLEGKKVHIEDNKNK